MKSDELLEVTSWKVVTAGTLVCFLSVAYIVMEREYLHVQALRFFAHMVSDRGAQYVLGQRYFTGTGVKRDKELAIYWFKEAARQGHPYAGYNLAVLHLQGYHRLQRKGEARDLLEHAAREGVKEADTLLNTVGRSVI